MHILKKFAPPHMEKREPPGRLPYSPGSKEHSEKALWPRENHTFEGGSPVFSREKCTFLSGPFLSFRHFSIFSVESVHSGVPFLAALQYSLWRSAHVLSFSLIFLNFLSVSFSFFHCFLFFFFSQVLKIFFFASIASRFPVKALMYFFLGGPSRGGRYPIGPSLFLLNIFSFFHFRFLFQFLSMLFLFFSFVFPFVFLLKNVSSFFILFLFFSFIGC